MDREADDPKAITLDRLYAPTNAEDEFLRLYKQWEKEQFHHIMGYPMPPCPDDDGDDEPKESSL